MWPGERMDRAEVEGDVEGARAKTVWPGERMDRAEVE